MRKIPSIALGLFLLLFLIPISKAQVYYVSECTEITEPGTYYLTQDIIDAEGTCFTISSNDVVFDCQGHTVDGVGWGRGIYASGNNITIKNCKISDFDMGLTPRGYNNTIINNMITSSSYGLILDYGDYNLIANNTISLSREICFMIDSSYSTIINNTITSCKEYGFVLGYDCDYNLIANNTISLSGICFFISRYYSEYNLITGNTISSCDYGFYLDKFSNNNTFTKNIITNNTVGMYFYLSYWNLIYNNLFNNTVHFQFEGEEANYFNTTKQKGERIVYHPSGFIGGNYWSNPFGAGYSDICNDEDGDGICDQPYFVAQNNIDYLPLSKYKPGVRPTPMQELLNAILAIIIVFGTLTYSITLFLDKIRIK